MKTAEQLDTENGERWQNQMTVREEAKTEALKGYMRHLFKAGFDASQSATAAWCDMIEFSREECDRIAFAMASEQPNGQPEPQ